MGGDRTLGLDRDMSKTGRASRSMRDGRRRRAEADERDELGPSDQGGFCKYLDRV